MTVPFMLLPAGLTADGSLVEPRADQFEHSLAEFVAEHLRWSEVEALEEASVQLAREFASPAGQLVEAADPERFHRWTRLAARLAAGAAGTTENGIRRLLRSYSGKPQLVLDALAKHPVRESVAQGALRDQLGIEETYMSKIVARLVEADLVVHWKSGRYGYLAATATGRRFAVRAYDEVAARVAQMADAFQGLLDESLHDPDDEATWDIVTRGLTVNRVLDPDLASEFRELLVTQAGRRHSAE